MTKFIGRKYLILLFSLLSANPRASADTIELANGLTLKTEQVKAEENLNSFQYGLVKVNTTYSPIKNLKLDSEEKYKLLPESLFVSDAHASLPSIDENIFTVGRRAHEALRSAIRFEDVRPFISNDAYQNLIAKRNEGSKEMLVLQLLRTSIPEEIEIIQTKIKGDLAWVVARGKMHGQLFWGILSLTRENGDWKLAEETWYGNNQYQPIMVKNMTKASDFLKQINEKPGSDFISWVDKAGQPRSTLPLENGRIKTPKRSFCFFFFYDPEKTKKVSSETPLAIAPSPDMHIVWPTGLRHDPKVYQGDNADGFDVSIAADKDGYYPNKMNLRMPKGKPKEIYVGVLVAF